MTDAAATGAGRAARVTRAYRPGEWLAVLGERTTLLLPPSETSRAAALWELVDRGAGADEVLDALVAGGLRRLPAFVLATTADDGSARMLLRGRVRATVAADGETLEVDGASASTWVERSWVSLDAWSVVLEEPVTGPELVVAGGLVRVARLEQPAPAGRPAAGGARARVTGDASPSRPASAPGHEPEAETELTDLGSLVDAPVPAGPAATASDHDGQTRAGGQSAVPEPRLPGIPGQPPAPPVTARPVARLVMSHGETVDVDRVVLVGRAPEARRFTSAEQPRLVTVPSPQQEISSTHLEIRPGSGADHGLAVVTDLGSTNGTVLVQPGLGPEDLRPGVAVQLIPGAVIDLGDGLTIEVRKP